MSSNLSAPSAPRTWRIKTITGGSGTISHPFIAVAPECPDERHPTRACACKVFRSKAQAEAYIESAEVPA